MKVIWSSGGGVQSTAIAILIRRGILPRPDRAVIADTGRETGETWEYLDRYVNPMLAEVGFTVERIPVAGKPSLFNSEGTILIPVFLAGGAKFANFCSSYWKREIVKKWALENDLVPAVNWIGYSIDEMRRVTAPRRANWKVDYPLIFMARMSRMDCVRLIEDFRFPPAPKSSCYICPNRRNPQWRWLRDNRPEEFREACAEDESIRLVNPDLYLHESRVPLAQADLGQDENGDAQLGLGCESGDCFV